MAGCTLGAPVEFWPIDRMEALAQENGDDFPPTDYWSYVPDPFDKRYEMSPRENYTRKKMSGVPVDDDITYTLLGPAHRRGVRTRLLDRGCRRCVDEVSALRLHG